jgi:membrane peptidoglycan carboxypeptidase
MPEPPQIVRFRQKRLAAHGRNPGWSLGLGIGLAASLSVVLGIFASLLAYSNLTADLPSIESIPARLEPPYGTWLQPTRLYDRSGEHVILTLQNPGAAGWRHLTVPGGNEAGDSFADSLVDATVSAVDPTFWENPGYLWKRFQDDEQDTLAQKLVADMLLSGEAPSLRRSLRQRLLAGQLVSRYGHAKVLEWYLNSVRYGPLVYGADAAARVYFGKSATELNLAEAAWLVAAAETSEIDPLIVQQGVLEQQKQIIAQMLIQGLIPAEAARRAVDQVLVLRAPVDQGATFQMFTGLVLAQVGAVLPNTPFERGGLRIITTLDYELQLQAQCTLETQVNRLQGVSGEVLTADGKICEAARLLPTLSLQAVNNYEAVAANLLILDPANSQVLGWVGQVEPGLVPAQQPGHPAGTLLTPFIYLTAFVHGFSPSTLVWDVPEASQPAGYGTGEDGYGALAGFELSYHGPVRLRTALANDYLGAAAQYYERIGAENSWLTAWQFGMTSLGENPTGSGSFIDFLNSKVTLLESVHAFSVLSNLGLQTGQNLPVRPTNGKSDSLSPVTVIRIEDGAGQIILDWSQPQQRSIVSPQLAYLVTNVLSDEMARWPSLGHPNLLEIGRPAGVRLGESLDGSQAWAVGYTPQIVVGSWLGTLEGEEQEVPPSAAAALWNAIIKFATQDMAVENWSPPAGITNLLVCDPSGLLPTNACPVVVDEVFISGNEPTQVDNLYQVMRINRETGLLATVFTPAELVETQIFLVLPTWAVPWAEQAGLPIPPSGYDPIYLPPVASLEVNLTNPAMFAHVRGQVDLRGSAAGDDFLYYRLQVGQGLNPREWLLIGEDVRQPVTNGSLGVWDTQGLQGLYVIQLLLVHTDQTVESSVLQVTVDNTPPEVTIMDPTAGEQFSAEVVENILLQAAVTDDLELDRVEFYLDGELVFTLWQSPYAGMRPVSPGTHTLLVRAYDRAGNSSEQVVNFNILR